MKCNTVVIIEVVLLISSLLVIARCQDENTADFPSNIIHFAHPYCIYTISDDYLESYDGRLYNIQEFATIRIDLSRVQAYNVHVKSNYCKPTGYILLINNSTALNDLLTIKPGYLIQPHSRVYIIGYVKTLDRYNLTTIKTASNMKDLEVVLVDLTNNKVRYLYNNQITDGVINAVEKPRWRPNFTENYVKFRVGFFHCPPYLYYSTKQQRLTNGLELYLLNELTRNWQIDYVLYPQFSWTAVITDLAKGKFDIGMCAHWDVEVAQRNVHLTYPYTQTCTTFLVPKPTLRTRALLIFQPLHLYLWISIVATLCFLTLCVRVLVANNVINIFIELLRVLCAQSIKFPTDYVVVWVFNVWLLSCVLLSTTYSGGISSALAAPAYTAPINTFEEMVANKVIWTRDPATSSSIASNSTNPYVIIIQKQAISVDTHTKNLAYYTNVMFNSFLTNTDDFDAYHRTHLKTISECLGRFFFITPLAANSAFDHIFDRGTRHFTETGLFFMWNTFTQYKDYDMVRTMSDYFTRLPPEAAQRVRVLSLLDFQGMFCVLAFGYLLAIAAFIIERLKKLL